jgi:hypothetical protein
VENPKRVCLPAQLKYKTPRTPGPRPNDIGPRNGNALKPCTDGKPHCFSSTPETFDELFNADEGTTDEWYVEPFKYNKPLAEAMADVQAAVAAYPPGQRGSTRAAPRTAAPQQ